MLSLTLLIHACRGSIMSSVDRDSFIFSFPIRIPFISFSCVTALARTSNTMLKSRGQKGNPRLAPGLSGKALTFSLLSVTLAVNFL